jgi:hypothetical protein
VSAVTKTSGAASPEVVAGTETVTRVKRAAKKITNTALTMMAQAHTRSAKYCRLVA